MNIKIPNFLKEVIKWYNHSHRNSSRSSKLKSTSNSKHELTVIDKSDLIPYGIYDIGIQIGFMEMKQKFRIKICKCLGDYKEEIYKSNVYPNNEKFTITNKNGQQQYMQLRDVMGNSSSFRFLQPYLIKEDIEFIEEKSSLKRINQAIFKTHDNKWLNYLIFENQFNLIWFMNLALKRSILR